MAPFSKFLISRLALQQHPVDGHPDANALTAFSENRLSARERQSILSHLAACSDCREVLSYRPAEQLPARSPQWRNFSWAAALAATCLLAFTISRHQPPAPVIQRATVQPQTPAPAPVVAVVPSVINADKAPLPKPAHKQFIPPQPASRTVVLAPSPMAASAPEIEQPVTSAKAFLPSPEQSTLGSHDIALGPKAPLTSARGLAPHASAFGSLAARQSLRKFTAPGAAATLHSIWAINQSPGGLSRSDDGGRTWSSVHKTGILALSVSGRDIWAGGEGGVLIHSVDNGLTWDQLTVSDGSAELTDSITAIVRVGEIIRIKTASGDWFSADLGHHWRKE